MGEGLSGNFEASFERTPAPFLIESRLNAMAAEGGHEMELTDTGHSAEWILYQRLLYLLIEEAPEWDPLARASLRKTIAGMQSLTFSRFTQEEQDFLGDLAERLPTTQKPIELNVDDQRLLSQVTSRVKIPFDPQPATITLAPPLMPKYQRITEIDDPRVTKLLKDASKGDKIDNILKRIGDLSFKQKVKLLLSLTDDEYEKYKIMRQARYIQLTVDILDDPELTADQAERIRATSQLRYTQPAYEIEAEIRRREPDYPAYWDKDLESDERFKEGDGLPRMKDGKKIKYEEAIIRARFEYARNFYRNIYFPSVVRRRNPKPITSLYEAYEEYRRELIATRKPGTDITMQDLIDVIDYYLRYEAENEENCRTHLDVRPLVEMVVTIEDAFEAKK